MIIGIFLAIVVGTSLPLAMYLIGQVTNAFINQQVCVCIYVYVCNYVYIYIYMYVCVCVCVCITQCNILLLLFPLKSVLTITVTS